MGRKFGITEGSNPTVSQEPDLDRLKQLVLSQTHLKALLIKIVLREVKQRETSKQTEDPKDMWPER